MRIYVNRRGAQKAPASEHDAGAKKPFRAVKHNLPTLALPISGVRDRGSLRHLSLAAPLSCSVAKRSIAQNRTVVKPLFADLAEFRYLRILAVNAVLSGTAAAAMKRFWGVGRINRR